MGLARGAPVDRGGCWTEEFAPMRKFAGCTVRDCFEYPGPTPSTRGLRRRACPFAAATILLALVGCAGAVDTGGGSRTDLWEMARESLSQIDGEITLPGLQSEVEVIRDRWGVPHIYATNDRDLFFAQGFVAAQDRLWQMEMWRLWLQGRRAEVEGPDGVRGDRLSRLLGYRGGDGDAEWTSYHPQGRQILESYVAGVNAFMDHRAANLPVEFKLTGIVPEQWTADVPTLRMAAGVGAGVGAELRLAQQVAGLGAEEAGRRNVRVPDIPLTVPEGVDFSLIGAAASEALRGAGTRDVQVELLPEFQTAAALLRQGRGNAARRFADLGSLLTGPQGLPVGSEWGGWLTVSGAERVDHAAGGPYDAVPAVDADYRDRIGSNNWVLSGALTASGAPMLANDPHRQVTNPSLRYLVHLSAPGWDVIGSGEPALPGVAIGHNEWIAWGLTIVGTDQNDLFIETLNPDNHDEVLYRGEWETLRIERETIRVKGGDPVEVELRFSRHGPIFYVDEENHLAYALRSFAQEPGTAPYLGSLRLDQTRNCRDFLEALHYWLAPSENMICGDVDGNIAWRASALTPNRSGATPWFGRLPVTGTGAYAWNGFRAALPEEYNPERGWIATANHNIQPPDYDPPLMFKRPPPERRFERLAEVLSEAQGFTVDDSERLQHDALSQAALEAQPLFRGWQASSPEVEWLRASIAGWDGVFDREEVAPTLYLEWTRRVDRRVFGDDIDDAERQGLIEQALRDGTERLRQRLGEDSSAWRWGLANQQPFPHWMVPEYDLPSVEKSGGGGTVYANGATYREIFDLSDWDLGVATTAPGQSGQPGSPFYGDRIGEWAGGSYFPLSYSRSAVEAAAAHRLVLKPATQ